MSSIHLSVDLSFNQLVEAVKQLSPKEKSLLNEVLWDEAMEIPAEHQALVLCRVKKADQNPERLLEWDEAFKSLKP